MKIRLSGCRCFGFFFAWLTCGWSHNSSISTNPSPLLHLTAVVTLLCLHFLYFLTFSICDVGSSVWIIEKSCHFHTALLLYLCHFFFFFLIFTFFFLSWRWCEMCARLQQRLRCSRRPTSREISSPTSSSAASAILCSIRPSKNADTPRLTDLKRAFTAFCLPKV